MAQGSGKKSSFLDASCQASPQRSPDSWHSYEQAENDQPRGFFISTFTVDFKEQSEGRIQMLKKNKTMCLHCGSESPRHKPQAPLWNRCSLRGCRVASRACRLGWCFPGLGFDLGTLPSPTRRVIILHRLVRQRWEPAPRVSVPFSWSLYLHPTVSVPRGNGQEHQHSSLQWTEPFAIVRGDALWSPQIGKEGWWEGRQTDSHWIWGVLLDVSVMLVENPRMEQPEHVA